MTTTNPVQAESLTLTMRQVRATVNLCRSTIERLIACGEFPRPRKVRNKILFDRAEVVAWWEAQREDGQA